MSTSDNQSSEGLVWNEDAPNNQSMEGLVWADRVNKINRLGWKAMAYVGTCSKCKAERLVRCVNDMHRCEVCQWSPEMRKYVRV